MINGANNWFVDFVKSDQLALDKLATRLVIHVGDSTVGNVTIGGDVKKLPNGVEDILLQFFKNGYESDELERYLVSTGFPEKSAKTRVSDVVKAATSRVADVTIMHSHLAAKSMRENKSDQ
ncbi:hypothetical protein CQZ99_09875 [Pseudomonas poae]|uniref:Uncharacterized protein n=2 Tax=Pseudomonas poae TaxID=200451 RepID=A0A2S9EUI5_9PSED|nr:hypothetical protein CQZ97_00730 [Pseudomonas poae]PRC19646.1 hypothetical protein CQZ99_09875 [Pseudomonas poae]